MRSKHLSGPTSLARTFTGALCLSASLILAASSAAQIPDTFTNLKVLDKDITKPEIVATMRDWAGALGFRCHNCHVGPDNLQGMDFASDEKATKRTARKMLEMTQKINRELLADLPTVADDGREQAQVVACYSCHRGLSRPPRRTLAELSDTASGDGGPAAAVARFQELRSEYSEAGQYDLRTEILAHFARSLVEQDQLDEARQVISSTLELLPDSADAWAALGFLELRSRNIGEARAALVKALELDPEHESAAWLIERVKAIEAKPAE